MEKPFETYLKEQVEIMTKGFYVDFASVAELNYPSQIVTA